MPSIPELLRDRVILEVDWLDRLYLNGYIGPLATPGGLVTRRFRYGAGPTGQRWLRFTARIQVIAPHGHRSVDLRPAGARFVRVAHAHSSTSSAGYWS